MSHHSRRSITTRSPFAGQIKSVIIPTLPAGLESAKLPTFGEKTFSFFAPLLGLLAPTATTATAPPTPTQSTSVVDFDFDNDGKADVGRWRVANTEFQIRNSNGGTVTNFTLPTATKITPGDFNGDGKTDAATFSGGTWTYKTSPSATAQTISFGTTGDIPVAGDYDGDGTTDAAVYRPSTNTWWIQKSSGGTTNTTFGATGDITVPGDYDGDGKNDLALFRPSTGDWHITPSSTGVYFSLHWGLGSDTPVPADFDGDGKTDQAVFRPSTGTWYVNRSDNGPFYQQTWGNYRDQPVPADYDGDGKADYAIWRPTTGVWYISRSSDSNFEMYTLGGPGDTAVPSAYLKQVGGEVTRDALNAARLSPRNATGGTDLYSQNFGWGTSLVNLPGRAGLDANLGISYNSLVWTKVGNAMVFDSDNSNASPGFRLGLPTIEPVYYDTDKGKNTWAYMMVTPSGSRVQFRQTVVTNVYETADSNYTQLIVNTPQGPNTPTEDLWLMVRTTDGTQMMYAWSLGAYRCTQIKDRNGNYISVGYDGEGRISTMTDTLGRVISVGYDSTTGLPSSVNFPRYGSNGSGSLVPSTAPWVSFTYTDLTINTTFDSSLTIVGPPNGTVIKVLDRITYADGSTTRFSYNGFAQVSKVETYAPNGGFLNYVAADYIQSPTSQTAASTLEVPLLRQTRTKVKDFNSDNEVTVTNEVRSGTVTDMDGASVSANLIQVQMLNHPTGNITNTYVGSSGWMEGLSIRVDDWANGTSGLEIKRSTFSRWTQDDTNAAIQYPINPRLTESRVSDGVNTKKTAIEYEAISTSSPIAKFGLVKKVEVGDLSTVYKTVQTSYELDADYINRRIIGLPSQVQTWGKNNENVSNMTYEYDEGNFSDGGVNQNISPTQHDTNYGSTFITGRGNATSLKRRNVDPAHSGEYITSSLKYNTAGAVVSSTDPMSRTVKIGYADVWNDGASRSTYAYPTVITDSAASSLGDSSHSSTIKYRFDIGANVEATSPAPTGLSEGKNTKRIYDSIGRLERDSAYMNASEYSYTRYEYPTNGIQAKVYTTPVDNGALGPDSGDEVLSETWTDGIGDVRWSRTEHPGSTGGWAATRTEYDILGRVKRTSVPTEVSVVSATNPDAWIPAGDDYRGMNGSSYVWLWTTEEYDWKNRVVRRINTDGDPATSNDSDIRISYDGCGCAGGQVTTIEGENIVETDWQGNTPTPLGRRKQKIYEDILGRTIKTETFDWDGSTVYSTTTHAYNGRDQITATTEYAGTTSGTSRTVTMSYDGHGRMATRHHPIEDSGADTSWTYNADDSINSVTDPRGIVTNFTYYSTTGLLHQIGYDVPSGQTSTVDDTPDVTFAYDNLGNRTSMSDGTGSVSYVYDELSRLESETRTITGLSGTFPINYAYTIGGAVKTFSDPQDSSVVATYSFDKLGRQTGVSRGTTGGSIHSTTFRAWGAIKEYRTSASGSTDYQYDKFAYDNRLGIAQYQRGSNTAGDGESFNYQRYADGMVKYAAAKHGPTSDNPTFDRRFQYDSVGRLVQGQSGFEANGRTDLFVETPYRNNVSYNTFGEIAGGSNRHWEHNVYPMSYTIGGSTGRVSTSGYDAAGNLTSERMEYSPNVINRTMKYDAAGRNVNTHDPIIHVSSDNDHVYDMTFDGNGWRVKKIDTSDPPSPSVPASTTTEYEFRSTVLGGEAIGKLKVFSDTASQEARFITPINGVKLGDRVGWSAPEGIKTYGEDGAELDTRGASVGEENPYTSGSGSGYPSKGGDPTSFHRCASGGLPEPCDPQSRAEEAFARIEGLIQQDRDKENEPSETRPTKTKRLGESDSKNGATTRKTSRSSDDTSGVAIDPALIPDATGENKDGCTFGKDNDPNCHVQSLHWKYDDVDASASQLNTEVGYRPQSDVRTLVRQNLVSFLNQAQPKSPCRNALDALKLTDQKLLDAFDKVSLAASKAYKGLRAHTSWGKKKPLTISTQAGLSTFLLPGAGTVLVHELVHAALQQGDPQVVKRLINAGINVPLPTKTKTVGRGRNRRSIQVTDYSQTLSNFFNDPNCSSAPATTKEEEE